MHNKNARAVDVSYASRPAPRPDVGSCLDSIANYFGPRSEQHFSASSPANGTLIQENAVPVIAHKFAGIPIANEPDGFGRWSGVRPASYDISAYLVEWRTFHAAIRARVPGALFAGPDVSGATDWIAAFAQAMPEGLVLLTHHCYADGPAGAPHVFLPKAAARVCCLARLRADALRFCGRSCSTRRGSVCV